MLGEKNATFASQKNMKRIALITIMALSALAGAADTVAQEAGELYAVLLSGGRNRLTNHERYWNDCAFLYRTLRLSVT